MPDLKMEIVAFLFFFRTILSTFFKIFVIGLSCNNKKPKAHQVHSAVTHCTVHINYFPPITVVTWSFFFFFHKVPLRQPHFCVNITVKIFILFAIAPVAQIYFFLFVINWEVATQFHALQILSKRQSWKEGSTGVKKVRLCY